MTHNDFLNAFRAEAAKGLALIQRKVEKCIAVRGVVLGTDFHPHKDGECMFISGITTARVGDPKQFSFYVDPAIMNPASVVQLADDLVRELSKKPRVSP